MAETNRPIDYRNQKWMGIDDKFPKRYPNATSTSDGLMTAEDKAKLDSIDVNDHNRIYDVVTSTTNGLMSSSDKKKLDNIEAYANNYVHPNTSEIRHVTDAEKKYWNEKASTDIVNAENNGLMSYEDKKKLDTIDFNANNYIHPDNEGVRHVTDAEKDYWNAKASKNIATNSENGLMSYKDKIKLDGIEDGANKYIHPDDSNHRHVTDKQIEYWNSKGSKDVATPDNNGLMSKEDKKALDKIVAIDYYVEDKHYVTIKEKTYWNAKVNNTDLVTQNKDGLLSSNDKIKLDGIEAGANNYTHPDDSNHRHVTDAEKEVWNNKASTNLVTPSNPGLMIPADKTKLDNIEVGANNYIHPNTPDTRHVTDNQIAKWDDKADKTVATQFKNGLLSTEDKVKLDTMDYNANNYIHPDTHPASMIIEDKDHRFITDAEREKWNKINDIGLATDGSSGLMSVEDKKKLDQLIVPENHELSLIYSEWTDIAPYEQVLNVPGVGPGINAYIGINSNATVEQMTQAAEANLKVGKVEQDKITIIATGKKPSMNLPIMIMAGSSILIFEVKQFNGREEYSYEPPVYGYHHENEIVYAYKPVEAGCIGWVCIKTGEPGEWMPFGKFELPK